MDINQIVTGLYLDRRVNELINRLEPADLRQDLLHHCILYVYTYNERHPGKIQGMQARGELFAWFSRCLKMELIGKNSAFLRRYRQQFEPLPRSIVMITDTSEDYSDWQEAADKRFGAGFWASNIEMIENKAYRPKSQPRPSQGALFAV